MPELKAELTLSRCPHCGADSPTLSKQAQFETNSIDGRNRRFWKVYACRRCGGAVTAWTVSNWENEMRGCFPEGKDPAEELPDRARSFLAQAQQSLNAPSGAVMLAASAVDAMLKQKGLTDGSLYSRIDQAASDGLITEGMAQWAHDVRLDANEQRHADVTAPMATSADAERAVDFAEAFGEFLFVLPARVQRGIDEAEGDE